MSLRVGFSSLRTQIGQVQVHNIASKWELAKRLANHAEAPEAALTHIFTRAIQSLEITARTRFTPSLKVKVWDTVLDSKLKSLQEIFFLEFCDKILGGFNEEQSNAMLMELRVTGTIEDKKNRAQLQAAIQQSQDSVLEDIIAKAHSMSSDIAEEIFNSIKSEGIDVYAYQVLENAIETENLEMVKEALQNGANPNLCIGHETILHRACEIGNIDIICELLNKGASLNSTQHYLNDTPLHRACVYGKLEVVKELINRGAWINYQNTHTPLEHAITFEHFECCKLLIEAGAYVNKTNWTYGSTPLTDACHTGNYEIVKLLLDSGADSNLSLGITPLYWAINAPNVVQLLIERGANVNAPNDPSDGYQNGQYPIHAAAMLGNVNSMHILLNAGADPNFLDGSNNSPIEIAKQQLNGNRKNPNLAEYIQNLEKTIGLLESSLYLKEIKNKNYLE